EAKVREKSETAEGEWQEETDQQQDRPEDRPPRQDSLRHGRPPAVHPDREVESAAPPRSGGTASSGHIGRRGRWLLGPRSRQREEPRESFPGRFPGRRAMPRSGP